MKHFYSHEQFKQDMGVLAGYILAKDIAYDGILSIVRGGLYPTAELAQLLNIRHIETVCLKSYESQERQELKVVEKSILPMINLDDNWLIVDDIADSGETLNFVKKHYTNRQGQGAGLLDTLTIHWKTKSIITPTYFVKTVPEDVWIQYPWEREF